MPSNRLGEVSVGIEADTKQLKRDLKEAEGETKKSAGRLEGYGLAIGAAVATAVGAAVIGSVKTAVDAVGGLVDKFKNLNDELFPAANRIGIAAAELHTLRQVADHLGSEDGLEGVTDSAQELSLRLQDMTTDGYRADEALRAIGLSGDDLRNMSPKDALIETIEALQGVEDQQHRNYLADELFGGQWENIAGILNVSTDEFRNLTEQFGAGEEAMQSTLDATWRLQQAQAGVNAVLEELKANIAEPLMNFLADLWMYLDQKVIPAVRDWWDALYNSMLPTLMEIVDLIRFGLIPAIGDFAATIRGNAIPAIGEGESALRDQLAAGADFARGAILLLIGVLRGDWPTVMSGVKLMTQVYLNQMITMWEFYANAVIDKMNKMAAGVEQLINKMVGNNSVRALLGAAGINIGRVSLGRIGKVTLGRVKLADDPLFPTTGTQPGDIPSPTGGTYQGTEDRTEHRRDLRFGPIGESPTGTPGELAKYDPVTGKRLPARGGGGGAAARLTPAEREAERQAAKARREMLAAVRAKERAAKKAAREAEIARKKAERDAERTQREEERAIAKKKREEERAALQALREAERAAREAEREAEREEAARRRAEVPLRRPGAAAIRAPRISAGRAAATAPTRVYNITTNIYGDTYGIDDFEAKIRAAIHQNGRIGASGS